MPRIRSVKPDFWNDEKIGQEIESVMLTFIGTWNFADDYGVVKANPVWLKNQIFPYKDKLRIDAFSTWLARLSELEAIIPFTLKGESFYYIRTFRKHQRVEKPSKARNCNEEDLMMILNTAGYSIQKDGEFIKQSVSSRGVVGECSPLEKDKEKDKEKEKDKDKEKKAAALLVNKINYPFGEVFKEKWLQWKNYKKAEHRFNYKSIESEEAALYDLVAMSKENEEVAIAIIQKTIAKGWKGLFELKIENNGNNAHQGPANGYKPSPGKSDGANNLLAKLNQSLQAG